MPNEPNSPAKREPGAGRLGSFVQTQDNCPVSSYPSHRSHSSHASLRPHRLTPRPYRTMIGPPMEQKSVNILGIETSCDETEIGRAHV